MYRARNLRECQEQLNRNLVQPFLLSNQSKMMMINDDKVDSDEPMYLFCGNSIRGLRCEYCRQRSNGKQLSHLIELKSLTFLVSNVRVQDKLMQSFKTRLGDKMV